MGSRMTAPRDTAVTGVTGVWFRTDLRVVDHAPLIEAARKGAVSCVVCLDPRDEEPSRVRGLVRRGPWRARFLREALTDLRDQLRALGGELLIRRGWPEEVLPELARQEGWSALHFHELVGTEEQRAEAAVRAAMPASCSVRGWWGLTLVDPSELPFAVDQTPELFTRFRKLVERGDGFPEPLPAPRSPLRRPQAPAEPGDLPSVEELGCAGLEDDPRAVLRFRGGSRAAAQRVQTYVWDEDRLKGYKQTRNGLVGADYSSKLSPWLALGCVSARQVQAEVERYERERVRNGSTYWLTFELLWRDYFQLIAAKHGAALFRASGLQGIERPWQRDEDGFEAWCAGRTGVPLVDANMRELARSGFMSNRGRQIVASFLTKNLGIDWRWGAEWFESQLLDFDVASNWGNWNYSAGVGNDARGFRYFDIATQASKYDRRGRHARLWCPELDRVPERLIHAPWQLTPTQQEAASCRLGRDYPRPLVDLDASVAANRRRWEESESG